MNSELRFRQAESDGGGGRIRTHEALRLTVFKTAAFSHSATPPSVQGSELMVQGPNRILPKYTTSLPKLP